MTGVARKGLIDPCKNGKHVWQLRNWDRMPDGRDIYKCSLCKMSILSVEKPKSESKDQSDPGDEQE